MNATVFVLLLLRYRYDYQHQKYEPNTYTMLEAIRRTKSKKVHGYTFVLREDVGDARLGT